MNWFSIYWFKWETLNSFHWANAYLLWLFLLIPLLFLLKWVFKSRSQPSIKLSEYSLGEAGQWIIRFRFLVPLFFMLGLVTLILAMGRPQLPVKVSESAGEGIDIAIALDVSDSMLEADLKPNRLEAAKDVAKEFIRMRLKDRIALIAFAGETVSLSPLTTDYSSLLEYLEELGVETVQASGTAIGLALASCINKLRDAPGKSKVALIISDGDNTAGTITPETSAELAKTYGVKAYTVAIGKPDSKEIVDERTLRMLSEVTSGRFYKATDNDALEKIFKEIDDLETNDSPGIGNAEMSDYYYQYLYWALSFFLISLLLRFTILGNLMQD